MKWTLCPVCRQVVWGTIVELAENITGHKCPKSVAQEFNAELDATIDFEMDDFGNDARQFWQDPDVRFMAYLARKGKI